LEIVAAALFFKDLRIPEFQNEANMLPPWDRNTVIVARTSLPSIFKGASLLLQ